MLRTFGTMAVRRLTRSSGTSMTRPTSLMAAFAAIVPKVAIWATDSARRIFAHVGDDFFAAILAEVDVDIGRFAAIRIEKALEQQVVLQRADVAQLQDVADNRPARRAAGAGRDPLADRETHEVPDDQEIAGKTHSANDVQLVLEPGAGGRHPCLRLRPCGGAIALERCPARTARADIFPASSCPAE